MAQSKWLKVGAVAFLSVGMLGACGDEEPVEENNNEEPVEENNNGETVVPGGEDPEVNIDPDSEEEENNGSGEDTGGDDANIDAGDTEVGDED